MGELRIVPDIVPKPDPEPSLVGVETGVVYCDPCEPLTLPLILPLTLPLVLVLLTTPSLVNFLGLNIFTLLRTLAELFNGAGVLRGIVVVVVVLGVLVGLRPVVLVVVILLVLLLVPPVVALIEGFLFTSGELVFELEDTTDDRSSLVTSPSALGVDLGVEVELGLGLDRDVVGVDVVRIGVVGVVE